MDEKTPLGTSPPPPLHHAILIQTRNTVSNAHKMIPLAPPCFVWQSPCFALGNPKIMGIKI